MNGRGATASLSLVPDARAVWPSEDLAAPLCARRESAIGVVVSVPGSGKHASAGSRCMRARRIQRARRSLFDGEIRRGNGVGWLTRHFPGLRVVTIDAGDLDKREAELTNADLRRCPAAVCDEAGVGPVMAAGQSYGGLAAPRGRSAIGCTRRRDCGSITVLWWGGARRGRW